MRVFKSGMLPLVMGLMVSAGGLLQSAANPDLDWRLLLLCAVSMLLVLRTRIHVLWLMSAGAVAGAVLGV